MLWPVMHQMELGPFSEMRRLQREMNRLFEGGALQEPFPAVNIWSNDEKIAFSAELPGVEPNDISVSVLGDLLTVEGKFKTEESSDGASWHRRERSDGKFIRTFRLPFAVDSSKVSAKSKDGVLKVVLPRAEESRPKRISVSE